MSCVLMNAASIIALNMPMSPTGSRCVSTSGVRTWLRFVGVPVTAVWNCAVSWTVIRQARIRVMGPSAAMEFVSVILDGQPPLSSRGQAAALRAVGCTIVSTKDMHPNLRALLGHLHKRLGEPPEDAVDDRSRFLDELGTLDHDSQAVVLRILSVAIVIDGSASMEIDVDGRTNFDRALEEAHACDAFEHPRQLMDLGHVRLAKEGRLVWVETECDISRGHVAGQLR